MRTKATDEVTKMKHHSKSFLHSTVSKYAKEMGASSFGVHVNLCNSDVTDEGYGLEVSSLMLSTAGSSMHTEGGHEAM